jgi:hypothetical protein
MKLKKIAVIACTGIAIFYSGCKSKPDNQNISRISSFNELKEQFANPPVDYRPAPFWIWNRKITEAEIDTQLVFMKNMGFGGLFVHARHSLITEYLSDEWFDLWGYTLKKAKKLNIPLWIYDEDYSPSGFAGGLVPYQMPQSYNEGTGMILYKMNKLVLDTTLKCQVVLKKVNDSFENITTKINDEAGKSGEYYAFYTVFDKPSAFSAGFPYIDLLHEGVTEKFIDITMRQGYEKYFKNDFGGDIKGVFTDEPSLILSPEANLIKWTPTLFETFKKQWGYDLENNLVLLYERTGNWQKVRYNYFQTLLDMYIDRWAKPWNEYTSENNLIWTGHYWEHIWPDATQGSDFMALYQYFQMPGIDLLFNQMDRPRPEQYGNIRLVKEATSVANQMGYNRILCETYGAAGWDVRFEDLKRLGDWQYAMGINYMNTHLVYSTLVGVRKGDFPTSFSYHEPWAMQYKYMNDYYARLSLALSAGEQINDILVIEPTTTAWMYNTPLQSTDRNNSSPSPELDSIDLSFRSFLNNLENMHVEYDLGSEDIMAKHGKVAGSQLVINKRNYRVMILPPRLENLTASTLTLLQTFLKNGGTVLSFCKIPSFIDGLRSEQLADIAASYKNNWITLSSLEEKPALSYLLSPDYSFYMDDTCHTKILHSRRVLKDGDILFFVNSSLADSAYGRVQVTGTNAIQPDVTDGAIYGYPSKNTEGKLSLDINLPPVGNLLLFISKEKTLSYTEKKQFNHFTEVKANTNISINRCKENVLTIDYLDIRFGNSQLKGCHFFKAADTLFSYYGFKNGNPWFWSVQFKKQTVERDTFGKNTGFEATYNFEVDTSCINISLQAVIEQSSLYTVMINDFPIEAIPGKWYLDRDFGVYDLTGHIKSGFNQLVLKACPMSVYAELQSVYILGDFSLISQQKGWKIMPPSSLQTGSWKSQGMPFYADAVSYAEEVMLEKGKSYFIELDKWTGIVAEVKVNHVSAGIIGWKPYRLDISDVVNEGKNNIEVLVYGSLKNMIGPFHNFPPRRGIMTPFEYKYPTRTTMPSGKDYDQLDYGLMNNFKVIEAN